MSKLQEIKKKRIDKYYRRDLKIKNTLYAIEYHSNIFDIKNILNL